MDKVKTNFGLEDECNTFLQITVNVYQTTRCHILKDGNLHINCCDNFNSQTWTKWNRHQAVMFWCYKATLQDTTALLTIPHTNGTFPQSLIIFQLQAEYGNTFSSQHDKVRDQKCACTKLKSGTLQCFLHSSLHDIKVKIIIYTAQWFSDCVGNINHITHLKYSLRLRVKEEMLLK